MSDEPARPERRHHTDAARHILHELADIALTRSPVGRSLEEACAELGIDPETVLARATDLEAKKHAEGHPIVTLDDAGNVVRRWPDGTVEPVVLDDE